MKPPKLPHPTKQALNKTCYCLYDESHPKLTNMVGVEVLYFKVVDGVGVVLIFI